MNNIIFQLEKDQMNKHIPQFNSGDTVEIKIWVMEGSKKKIQIFEGLIISVRHRGFNSSFTIRKISNNEGIERVFQTHSPLIQSIRIKRYGDVRKSKLYYLRQLSGKNARIKEKLNKIK